MIFTGPSTDGLARADSGNLLMMNVTKSGEDAYKGVFNIVLNAK
jgi:hypothetical protein